MTIRTGRLYSVITIGMTLLTLDLHVCLIKYEAGNLVIKVVRIPSAVARGTFLGRFRKMIRIAMAGFARDRGMIAL